MKTILIGLWRFCSCLIGFTGYSRFPYEPGKPIQQLQNFINQSELFSHIYELSHISELTGYECWWHFWALDSGSRQTVVQRRRFEVGYFNSKDAWSYFQWGIYQFFNHFLVVYFLWCFIGPKNPGYHSHGTPQVLRHRDNQIWRYEGRFLHGHEWKYVLCRAGTEAIHELLQRLI